MSKWKYVFEIDIDDDEIDALTAEEVVIERNEEYLLIDALKGVSFVRGVTMLQGYDVDFLDKEGFSEVTNT